MNDASARQVIEKVAARLRALHEALHRNAGRLGLGHILAGCCGRFLKLQSS